MAKRKTDADFPWPKIDASQYFLGWRSEPIGSRRTIVEVFYPEGNGALVVATDTRGDLKVRTVRAVPVKDVYETANEFLALAQVSDRAARKSLKPLECFADEVFAAELSLVPPLLPENPRGKHIACGKKTSKKDCRQLQHVYESARSRGASKTSASQQAWGSLRENPGQLARRLARGG